MSLHLCLEVYSFVVFLFFNVLTQFAVSQVSVSINSICCPLRLVRVGYVKVCGHVFWTALSAGFKDQSCWKWHMTRPAQVQALLLLWASSLTCHQYSPMWSNAALPFSYSDLPSLTWRPLTHEPLLAENSLELCLTDYFKTVWHAAVLIMRLNSCSFVLAWLLKYFFADVPWKVFHIPERKGFISLYCCKRK